MFMKIVKRIFFVFAVLIGLVIVFYFSFPAILGMVSRDISPIDDRDLQLRPVTLLDLENAYFDLNAAGKALSLSDDEIKSLADRVTKKTLNNAQGTEILQNNVRALELFARAAEKGKYQNITLADPSVVTFAMAATPKSYEWRQLARLSVLNAYFLQRQEKGREAVEEAMQSVRIGSAIADSQTTMVEYFMALSMKKLGLEALIDIIPTASDFDKETSMRIISELANYFNNENGLQKTIKLEYIAESHMVDQVLLDGITAAADQLGISDNQRELKKLSEKAKNMYFFQPNKTKEIFAYRARASLSNIDKPCGQVKFPDDNNDSTRSPLANFVRYFEANGIGRLLITGSFISYRGAFERRCQDNLLVGATQTLFAIKAFRIDTGAYPASLDELVPKYLVSIPQDPFDGKPLRYSFEKKVLYSVGQDLVDSGGDIEGEWTTMLDPSFPLSF